MLLFLRVLHFLLDNDSFIAASVRFEGLLIMNILP
jgi:hypothetical protein